MVYIKRWAEFHSKCVELYKQSPDQTRYLIKATPSQQWLVLKVTDDRTCLKFKARSAIIINRFESFTRDMTALMAGLPLPSEVAISSSSKSTQNAMDMDTETVDPANKTSGTMTGNVIATTSGGGSANKKKKKKGKK